MADALLDGREDQRDRVCRCGGCGFEAQCTPWCDFYAMPDHPEAYLLCGSCIVCLVPVAERKRAFGVQLSISEARALAKHGQKGDAW